MSTLTLRPTGTGTYDNGTAYGASNKWECVDDVSPDDDTTRVYSWFGGSGQSYLPALADHTSETGTISNVRVYVRMKFSQYDSEETFPAGEYSSPYSIDYSDKYYDWATNPNTSDAWTWDEIDALQAGVFWSGSGSGTINLEEYIGVYTHSTLYSSSDLLTDTLTERAASSWLVSITQIYVVVTYTASTPASVDAPTATVTATTNAPRAARTLTGEQVDANVELSWTW